MYVRLEIDFNIVDLIQTNFWVKKECSKLCNSNRQFMKICDGLMTTSIQMNEKMLAIFSSKTANKRSQCDPEATFAPGLKSSSEPAMFLCDSKLACSSIGEGNLYLLIVIKKFLPMFLFLTCAFFRILTDVFRV